MDSVAAGLLAFVVLVAAPRTACDVVFSVAEMTSLVDTLALAASKLQSAYEKQEDTLDELKRRLQDFQRPVINDSSDLDIAMNQFLLVKRLTSDWQRLHTMMTDDVREGLANLTNRPNDTDLTDAVTAILRLQDTYQLDAASLAQEGNYVSADDCYQIGLRAHTARTYVHALDWFQEALRRSQRDEDDSRSQTSITMYIVSTQHRLGKDQRALDIVETLLNSEPENALALEWKNYLQGQLQNATQSPDNKQASQQPTENDTLFTYQFEKLCRGSVSLPAIVRSKLRCRFVTRNNPFLLLGPIKEEELNMRPRIVLFHDAVYDSEIETLKRLGQPVFQNAGLVGVGHNSKVRNSRIGWLEDTVHLHVKAVNQRVEDMTGLSTSTAEQLQVANYGMGGHYFPHYDYLREGHDSLTVKGNRIATVLFYLNDVRRGGATAFPKLGIAVTPLKGTAVFWHNLRSSGERDVRTFHGACPVLLGTKWAANKWLRSYGQEFRRRCSATPFTEDDFQWD